MARVVILTGSPHYEGASQKLADSFEKGVKEASNHVYRYDAGLQGDSQPHFLQLEHASGMEVGIPDNDEVEKKVIPELLDADVVVLYLHFIILRLMPNLKQLLIVFMTIIMN